MSLVMSPLYIYTGFDIRTQCNQTRVYISGLDSTELKLFRGGSRKSVAEDESSCQDIDLVLIATGPTVQWILVDC